MTPWPDEPGADGALEHGDDRALRRVQVAGLPRTSPERLAEAGSALPLADWLSSPGRSALGQRQHVAVGSLNQATARRRATAMRPARPDRGRDSARRPRHEPPGRPSSRECPPPTSRAPCEAPDQPAPRMSPAAWCRRSGTRGRREFPPPTEGRAPPRRTAAPGRRRRSPRRPRVRRSRARRNLALPKLGRWPPRKKERSPSAARRSCGSSRSARSGTSSGTRCTGPAWCWSAPCSSCSSASSVVGPRRARSPGSR